MYGIVACRLARRAPACRVNDSTGIAVSKDGGELTPVRMRPPRLGGGEPQRFPQGAKPRQFGNDPINLIPVSQRIIHKTTLRGRQLRHQGGTCPGY
jgi:hypothetical protein